MKGLAEALSTLARGQISLRDVHCVELSRYARLLLRRDKRTLNLRFATLGVKLDVTVDEIVVEGSLGGAWLKPDSFDPGAAYETAATQPLNLLGQVLASEPLLTAELMTRTVRLAH